MLDTANFSIQDIFNTIANKMLQHDGVEQSTMMKTPCLRYKGEFMAMIFDKADSLIIKVSSQRVNDIIREGKGLEFTFTKKRFSEWVLIPHTFVNDYESFIQESLIYAQLNSNKKTLSRKNKGSKT